MLGFFPSQAEDYSEEQASALKLVTYDEELSQWRNELHDLFEKMKVYSRDNQGKTDARELVSLRLLVRKYHDYYLPRLRGITSKQPAFMAFEDIVEVTNAQTKVTENYSRIKNLLKIRQGRLKRNGIRFDRETVKRYEINPNDQRGNELWHQFLLQLSAEVLLLDSFVMGFSPFIETKAFRSLLLRDLKDEVSENLEALWFESMEKIFKRQSLEKAIKLYDNFKSKRGELSLFETTLTNGIEKSSIYKLLLGRGESITFFDDLIRNMNFMAKRRWDTYRAIGLGALFESSKLFGNTLGVFQSRHGYLYHWSKEKEEEVAAQLKPLDVIMEKTPFRLTDKFIPGHFGHAAIWTGTEAELKKLGVWQNLPALTRNAREKYNYQGPSFHNLIRKGGRVIEALRPGVQLNTFRHFLEIDDLATLRARSCDKENVKDEDALDESGELFCLNDELRREYLLKAFSQIGKDYDFAFDVNTEQTIVCSELIYRTYLDVDFEISLTVGQHNISPDQVAHKGDEEGDLFSPILFYHEGKKVDLSGEELRDFMRNLMFPKP